MKKASRGIRINAITNIAPSDQAIAVTEPAGVAFSGGSSHHITFATSAPGRTGGNMRLKTKMLLFLVPAIIIIVRLWEG